jgi:hypothetical protein
VKRANLIALVGAMVLGVLALAAAPSLPGRPGSEFSLVQMLNGTNVRWYLFDGGVSQLQSTGGTIAYLLLADSGAQVVKVCPLTPMNLCVKPTTTDPTWDAGCSATTGDYNFGEPMAPFVCKSIVLDPQAMWIAAMSDSGIVNAAVFKQY